jgi:hypothetical protein
MSLKAEAVLMLFPVPRIAPFFDSELRGKRPQGASVRVFWCSENEHSSSALWECGNRGVCDFQGAVESVENLPFGFPRFPWSRHFHSVPGLGLALRTRLSSR